MNRPWDPLSITFAGEPIVGAIPVRLVVYGVPMTALQSAMLQAAYASFTARARLSVVPNPTEHGLLPDGSRYALSIIGRAGQAQVWPIGAGAAAAPEEEEGDSGVLVIWPVSGTPTQMLLKPAGVYGTASGNWSAVSVSGRTYGVLSSWPVSDRPISTALNWHAATGKEYYSISGSGYAERKGVDVVEAAAMNFSERRSGLVAIGTGAEKVFRMAFMTDTEAHTYTAPGVTTDTGDGPFPKAITFDVDPVMRTVALPDQLTGLSLAPNGTSAVATVVTFYEPETIPDDTFDLRKRHMIPYWETRWTPSVDAPNGGYGVFRVFLDVQPKTVAYRHLRTGSDWDAGTDLYNLEEGSCTPDFTTWRWISGNPSFFSGGVQAQYLAFPTRTSFEYAGDFCSFEGTEDRTTFTDIGPIQYTETQRLDSGEWINSTQPLVYEASGLWHGLSGTVFHSPQRTTWEYDMALDASYSHTVIGRFTCDENVTNFSGDVSAAITESGTINRSTRMKTTVDANGSEFVVRDYRATEAITYSNDFASNNDTFIKTQSMSASVDLHVWGQQRRVLCYDPQFQMMVFTETTWDYTRSPSATMVRHDNDGGGWVYDTESGGDSATAPSRPTIDLVIKIGNTEVLRDNLPDYSPASTHSADGITHDATFPFFTTRRINNQQLGSDTESAKYILENGLADAGARLLPIIGGTYPDSTPISRTEPHLIGVIGGLGPGRGPVDNPATASIDCKYAKDPRTGAGVLRLHRTDSGTAYSKAFLVDPTGVRALSTVAPTITVSDITTIAPS